jgi:ATP-binding cassette, subfamily B, bacterial
VGPTGSGKSTLTKLILRFYESRHGLITIDGEPIENFSLKDLRKSISFVGQDIFLFHGTVRDNISYGSFDSTLDDIIEAAKMAEAHQFIKELPQGYETIVGERGQTLSGGQRQRISIARALLKKAPILILDEATSNVDNETEASLQRALEKASQGRTTLILAHRLSTVRHSDHIIVLENGKIVEEGTHDKLLSSKGLYKRLWDVQTGERKLVGEEVLL